MASPQHDSELESSLWRAMQQAKRRVLPYLMIERIKKTLHLADTTTAASVSSLLFMAVILVIALMVNWLTGVPRAAADLLALSLLAAFSGMCLWLVKVIEDKVFEPNMIAFVTLPAEGKGYQVLEDWFNRTFRVVPQLIWMLIVGIASVISARVLLLHYPGLLHNFGLYFCTFISFCLVGNGAYFALFVPTIVSAVCSYRLNLYPYDPAKSGIVRIAKTAIGMLTLGTGVAAATVMVFVVLLNPWGESHALANAIGWLLFVWFVTSYVFIYPNYYVSKGIMAEKERQITYLDALIMQYAHRIDSLSPDEFKQMQQYMDLRERVWNSANSSFSIQPIFGFIVSLVLPLVSTILTLVQTMEPG